MFSPKSNSYGKLISESFRASSCSIELPVSLFSFIPHFRLSFSYTFSVDASYSEPGDSWKLKKIVQISMNSDAVFHEESEYVIGFKIWVTYEELSSIFRKNCSLFFAKNAKMLKKYLTCIFIKMGSS